MLLSELLLQTAIRLREQAQATSDLEKREYLIALARRLERKASALIRNSHNTI